MFLMPFVRKKNLENNALKTHGETMVETFHEEQYHGHPKIILKIILKILKDIPKIIFIILELFGIFREQIFVYLGTKNV